MQKYWPCHGFNAAHDKLIRVSGDEISSKKVPKLGAPNQTVKFVHYLKDISDTQTWIKLSFALLEPKFEDDKTIAFWCHQNFLA